MAENVLRPKTSPTSFELGQERKINRRYIVNHSYIFHIEDTWLVIYNLVLEP